MNKKAKTVNVTGKGSVLSVKAEKPQVKKFDVLQAETVEAEEIKTEEEPQPQEATATEAPKQQEIATVAKTEQRRIPTMQELKESVTTLYLLQEKHTALIAKRASLNKFAITHQKDNAEVVVTDAHGEEFTSRSPKTIAKLIEFWKQEFDEAIAEVEAELQKIFLGEAA
ncbi:MAG: hypothetical protein LBS20_10885 [Prevotella sp.]|jgi:ABC-type uncharacterized transport system permease subunit|nr:hypothetical protein [Prevotella sp.]